MLLSSGKKAVIVHVGEDVSDILKLTLIQSDALCIGDDIKVRFAPNGAYRTSILVEAPKGVEFKRVKTDMPDESVMEYKTNKSKISIMDSRRK